MVDLKFGLKLWSINQSLLPQAVSLVRAGDFHYIELAIVPNSDIQPFLDSQVPFLIHMTPDRFRVNLADVNSVDKNVAFIEECLEWTEQLGSLHLIVHPGFDGNSETSRDVLRKSFDPRILIENMPKKGLGDEKMMGYSAEEIKSFVEMGFGFCFDLNHAIKAAISLNADIREYLEEFMQLNPKVFHISDGHLNEEKDEHLAIGEGDYDFSLLIEIMRKSNHKETYVTLETPKSLTSLIEDVKNLKKIQEFL